RGQQGGRPEGADRAQRAAEGDRVGGAGRGSHRGEERERADRSRAGGGSGAAEQQADSTEADGGHTAGRKGGGPATPGDADGRRRH
ncbi:stress-induced protein, partial [Mycobacterium tuberculosis]